MTTIRGCLLAVTVAVGCAGEKTDTSSSEPKTEALRIPDDPATADMPVGVRTVDLGGASVEVWYPASDSVQGEAGESVALADLIPQSVSDVLGDAELPSLVTNAVRDAPLRALESPMPVVLFSHGFGGFAQQSVDITTHLAGRGFVVFSTVHSGRSIGDLLPCLFTPPLDGCALPGTDPGPDDLNGILAAIEFDAGFLQGRIDPSTRAVVGHSAGGGTTNTMAETDAELDAAVVMAAGPVITTDVPVLLLDGSCDGIVPETSVAPAFESVPNGTRVRMDGAGHLAFSDLCELELGRLAEELLEPRDDINELFLGQLVGLGTDGCPGGEVVIPECGDAFMPLSTSDPVVRASIASFLELHLRGTGPGVASDYGAGFEVSQSGG